MSEDIASTFGRTGERRFGLRLDTLMRLRWRAVAGQTIALVTVHWGLGFPFPLGPALAIVAVTALTNLALWLRYTGAPRLGGQLACGLLAFDLIQLSLLLYLTGGIDNPLCVLFLEI